MIVDTIRLQLHDRPFQQRSPPLRGGLPLGNHMQGYTRIILHLIILEQFIQSSPAPEVIHAIPGQTGYQSCHLLPHLVPGIIQKRDRLRKAGSFNCCRDCCGAKGRQSLANYIDLKRPRDSSPREGL